MLAASGAAIAIYKYFDEREKENATAWVEANKPFITKRQEVYYDLVTTTSTIGNLNPDDSDWIEADKHFWWLFWGSVPMVADEAVGEAINEFSVVLDERPADGIVLRNLSMNLARACRRSLGYIEPEEKLPLHPWPRRIPKR